MLFNFVMKRFFLIYLLLQLTLNLFTQTVETKTERIIQYYSLCKSDTSTENKLYFFRAFPDYFVDFRSIYGYSDAVVGTDTYVSAPLYEESMEHICFFCNLCGTIAPAQYYKKMINITINGYWQADAVNYFRSCLMAHLLSDPDTIFLKPESYHSSEIFLSILETYPQNIQLSFWTFFFDAMYIDFVDFQDIYNKICVFSNSHGRLYKFMKKGYKKNLKKLRTEI